jgi:hypothetical protein
MEYDVAKETINNAQRLNDIFRTTPPSIGFAAAGGMGYVYNGFVYDVLGLNQTQFAHADTLKTGYKGHQSFNKRVLLELQPDIFIPLTTLKDKPVDLAAVDTHFKDINTWDHVVFKGIFNDETFRQHYVLARVYNTEHPTYQCYGFFSKTYLAKIGQNKKFRLYTI